MVAVVRITGDSPKDSCVTSDGVDHYGPSCLNKAARHLIAQGADPMRKMNVMRGDQIVLIGTIHAFALRVWAGSDRDPAFRRWRPMPDETLPPALAAWWRRQRAR